MDDKLYDKIPSNLYPENEVQGALITTPVFRPMQDFTDWGGWWFAQELTSDEMVCPTRHTDWDDGGKWRVLHQHTWTNTTEAIAAMWGRFYEGIGVANQVIEGFEGTTDDPEIAKTIAKVKIMRAYYYYLLIDNYGNVPYVTSFSSAPKQPSATDRKDIFEAIVEEIETNIPFLSSSASKTGVTKGMAFSLLAKLYLNAEVYTGTPQWEKAENMCDSVINLGIYSLESNPLGPFITDNTFSPENIFVIPYDEDTYKGFNLHRRTLHYNHNLTFKLKAAAWNGFAAMEDHYNTYSDDDLRKEGFLVGQQYAFDGKKIIDIDAGTELILDPHIPALVMDASYTPQEIRMSGAIVVKFEVKIGGKGDLSNDYPIFRYGDILLMKAESMIRQGKNGDNYVNEIRSRAGISNLNNVDLDMLLEERGREMFWEGHRRQDLIRFDKFNDSWWEKSTSSPDRNVFPIPQWVIDSNPNLG